MRLVPFCAGAVLLAAGSGAAPIPTFDRAAPAQSLPASVRSACDLIAAVARATRGVKVQRKTGSFDDERKGIARTGCTISVTGSFAALKGGNDVFEEWHEAFLKRGWREELTYTADGPGGTAFAFVSGGVVCLFRGDWDGGDDTQPDAPRDDTYRGSGSCAMTGGEAVRSIPR